MRTLLNLPRSAIAPYNHVLTSIALKQLGYARLSAAGSPWEVSESRADTALAVLNDNMLI